MKTCVLVNCFACSNEMRVEPIRSYFDNLGFKTIYVASDFHHTKKQYVKLNSDITPVHTKKYRKNISLSRLYSHYDFSRKVYDLICGFKPDVVYIKFPPNSLVKTAYKIKKKLNCKIILDMFDLWPESLPVNRMVKMFLSPVTKIWAYPRNNYLKNADQVLLECNMYKHQMKDFLPENSHVVYLTKDDIQYCEPASYLKDECRICYLGGINNLIDIELIGAVISFLKNYYRVYLEIIGDGVNKDSLINSAKKNGAEVNFHGIIYDESDKYKIMRNCDFGLNLMKKTSKVALSLKSIEYFRAGLALINNIPDDTWFLVNYYNAGINISDLNSLRPIVEERRIIFEMKKRARLVFEEQFSRKAFTNSLDSALKKLMSETEMIMKRIVVISGINIRNAGTLTIFYNMLDEIIQRGINYKYDFILMVSEKKIFERYTDLFTIIEFPKEKKSRIIRFWYEYVYFPFFSKRQDIYIWISINDKTPAVKAEHQFTYCHNPTMFYKCSNIDIKFSKLLVLYTLFYGKLYKTNIKRNDAVIVQQSWIANEFKKRFPIKRVLVMRPSYTNILPRESVLAINECTFIYPTAARTFKNCEALLEATKILVNHNISSFKVIITIDGSENQYSKFLIKKYGYLKNVDFIGFVTRTKLEKLYASSNCLVFPSKLETWGLPMSEFSRYEKNIIAADLPYAHETLKDYKKKSFFKVDDYVALADKMKLVIQGVIFNENKESFDVGSEDCLESWGDFFEKVSTI